ncbi:MAG: hypothetical protein GX303_04735 [Clostridiales bacterium]|nr:hypothetical protein [Clostridiales bacterium]
MQNSHWVCGWGASTTRIPYQLADSFEDTTIRYLIFPTIDGGKIRIRLSNYFGTEKVRINAVYAATVLSGSNIDPNENVKLTFGGQNEAVIAPGEEIVSDPVDFNISHGKMIAVSLYFKERTSLTTGHSNNGPYIKKYFTRGNYAAAPEFPPDTLSDCPCYVFLNGLDIWASEDTRAIIAIGDSITAQPWPDCLARRLLSLGITNRAVIRKGISGNRLLREYKTYRPRMHHGISLLSRFKRDILQPGADRIFMLIGINDLLHPGPNHYAPMSELPSAEDMIEGYKFCIETARGHNMKIYLSTILPTGRFLKDDMLERETLRTEINDWIRSTDLIDGLIDFDSALRDENDHRRLKAEYDSGDLLHPSLAGAKAMANAIPEEYLK